MPFVQRLSPCRALSFHFCVNTLSCFNHKIWVLLLSSPPAALLILHLKKGLTRRGFTQAPPLPALHTRRSHINIIFKLVLFSGVGEGEVGGCPRGGKAAEQSNRKLKGVRWKEELENVSFLKTTVIVLGQLHVGRFLHLCRGNKRQLREGGGNWAKKTR